MKVAVILAVCCFVLYAEHVASFECLAPDGTPRDWFIIYKLPKIQNHKNANVKDGMGYFYMDNKKTSLVLSKVGIDKTNDNALYNTLQQIYKPPASQPYMHAFYNDQPPKGEASSSYGHLKGVVGFDQTDGFWLVHSTPRFPPERTQGFNWPDSAKRNGQTFLCASYPFNIMNEIGEQLIYDYPKVYDSSFPQQFVTSAPDTKGVLETTQAKKKLPPWNSRKTFKSKAGTTFKSFAKSAKFAKDLYEDFVATKLRESLYVQTWRPDLKADCKAKYKVMNIRQVKFLKENIVVEGTKDHSKWAVSVQKSGIWTCIGDINRARSQFKRGGGTLCIKNRSVSNQFRALVFKKDKCK